MRDDGFKGTTVTHDHCFATFAAHDTVHNLHSLSSHRPSEKKKKHARQRLSRRFKSEHHAVGRVTLLVPLGTSRLALGRHEPSHKRRDPLF